MKKDLNEKELYRRKIIEMVEKIDNLALLIKILSFIEAWVEE